MQHSEQRSLKQPKGVAFVTLGSSILVLVVIALLIRPAGASPVASGGVQHGPGAAKILATPTCIPAWGATTSPNVAAFENYLLGVTSVSTNESWAAGYSRESSSSPNLPMIQRWDGAQWDIVATPPVTESGYLRSIDAISTADIWAVGYSFSGMGTQTLTMHWNGSQWSTIPSPNRSSYQFQDYLMGVTAVSANDVWAVGYFYNRNVSRYNTLTLHWDGSAWSVVSSPNPGGVQDHLLTSVTAVATNDVWAVGYYTVSGDYHTLALHWNGSTWSAVSTPNPGSYDNYLTGVSTDATGAVWAVGYLGLNSSGDASRVITMRWNGSAWQSVSAPNPDGTVNKLSSVVVLAPNDVWAAGFYGVAQRTLTMHWDGSAWTVFPSPNAVESGNALNAIAASPTGNLWAVGNVSTNNVTSTFTIYYPGEDCAFPTATQTATITPTPSCGTDWRPVPNPAPDNSVLFDLEVVSPVDIWTVGSYYTNTPNGSAEQTLTMHWNGSTWSVVPSPNANGFTNRLNGVSAVATNDVWAVGFYNAPSPGVVAMLVLHWNGAQWALNPGPAITCLRCIFNDVEAVSANAVYAVGYSTDGFESGPMIARWDGAGWGRFYSNTTGRLQSVKAVTPGDLWAVGNTDFGGTLILHWNGTGSEWVVVPSPNPSPHLNTLNGIEVVSATDIWAVGFYQNNGLPRRTLIVHWNGSNWSVVPSPNPGAGDNTLNSISAHSATDIWTVGLYNNGNGAPNQTVAMRWNGSAWSQAPTPNPGTSWNALSAVVAIAPDDAWAVGYFRDEIEEALVLHFANAPCTGTVTATYTPVPPTSTRTATRTPTPRPTNTPTATLTPVCGLDWHVVTSPNASIQKNTIDSVSVINPNDIWAAGTQKQHWDGTAWTLWSGGGANGISGSAPNDVWAVSTVSGSGYHTRIEHWDGSTWSVVPSPNPDSSYNFLTDVVALSSDNAWAVGYYGFTYRTLALHWDGVSWTQVASPNYGAQDSNQNTLESVSALSATDIWATGSYWDSPSARYQMLVLHWNGVQWSLSLAPPPETNSRSLIDISASAPDDVWAVGSSIMHWAGASWTEVPNPVGGSLSGVTALAPNNVWVAGSITNAQNNNETLLIHWDGSTWQRITTPNPDPYSSNLTQLGVVSPDNIWAIGYTGLLSNGSLSRTLTEHYFDPCTVQTPIPTATVGPQSTSTRTPTSPPTAAATATRTGTVAPSNTPTRTDTPPPTQTPGGPSATTIPTDTATSTSTSTPTNVIVNTPTGTNTSLPTQTPGGPTATVAPSNTPILTGTPTPTLPNTATPTTSVPTPCTIEFSDVSPENVFYQYVKCLVCHGILSGYADGTFRPGNDITRGQIAKIVSNAAGIADDPGPRIFEDAAPENTFFMWINRLANHGFMGGYPCGNEGEPCNPPGNLPYFRPFANATRGQLAKIVSNAAGLNGTPTGLFYSDVPEEHPFYVWIMRLTNLGVMGGYPCGGEGEPCDSENRPYFRPFNNVTRGQASKIVANTFLPDCQMPAR